MTESETLVSARVEYELSPRTTATAAGGMGLIGELVKQLGVAEAIIDAEGVMVETYGRCKAGADLNDKKQWGYHPLVMSLANTSEPLFIA